MKITKEILQTVAYRGENLKRTTKTDNILNNCLRNAIDGSDFTNFRYNIQDEKEVRRYEVIAKNLKELGFSVNFDGDEGREYMSVSWY